VEETFGLNQSPSTFPCNYLGLPPPLQEATKICYTTNGAKNREPVAKLEKESPYLPG
jgi:hypothetical protein